MKSFAAAFAAGVALAATKPCAANAQISDDVVKIGVLTDMSGAARRRDRKGFGGRGADGGNGLRRQGEGQAGRGDRRRPPEQARRRRQHCPQLVRQRQGRCDLRRTNLLGGAAGFSALTREKNKININSGGGSSDITGTACSPNTVHWTYDTYALSTSPTGRWSGAARTPGSSSPPTTPSAWRWSIVKPVAVQRAAAARSSAAVTP